MLRERERDGRRSRHSRLTAVELHPGYRLDTGPELPQKRLAALVQSRECVTQPRPTLASRRGQRREEVDRSRGADDPLVILCPCFELLRRRVRRGRELWSIERIDETVASPQDADVRTVE